MIAALTHTRHFLRALAAMFLIMLMACKVALPVLIGYSALNKSAIATTSDSDDEKKAENNPTPEKEKEFTNSYSGSVLPARAYLPITHSTAYLNNYKTIPSLSVFGPPPDAYLQFSA